MNAIMMAAMARKGIFKSKSKKSKKSLLGAVDGTPKKKAKPKAKATGYRPAAKSTSMK
jgi:hypothetical protein